MGSPPAGPATIPPGVPGPARAALWVLTRRRHMGAECEGVARRAVPAPRAATLRARRGRAVLVFWGLVGPAPLGPLQQKQKFC
jgi:hypothetical protein